MTYLQIPSDNEWDGKTPLSNEVLLSRQVLIVEKLKNLFKGNRSRSEVVATFLAVLELCKTGSAVLEDDNSGEDPTVKLIKNPEEVANDGNY